MKRPAQRRSRRAQAQGVRISGRSGQGTAAQPRIKSDLTPQHACLCPPTGCITIADCEVKFRALQKLFLSTVMGRPAAAAARSQNGKAGASRPFSVAIEATLSVAGGDRATPAEAVVHADLDGVLVVPEAGADDRRGATGEGGAAEIVVLVFGLGGPVRCKHVFEAGADGIAVRVISVGGKRRRRTGNGHAEIVVVAPGVTALGVEQRRAPSVAEPAGDRTKLIGLAG